MFYKQKLDKIYKIVIRSHFDSQTPMQVVFQIILKFKKKRVNLNTRVVVSAFTSIPIYNHITHRFKSAFWTT